MGPKAKEEKSKCRESCCSDHQSTRVFLLPSGCDAVDLDLVQLSHPGTGKATSFLFSNTDSKLYELLTFNDKFRSYFVGSSVKSDGRMYIATPVDPLFLVVPYLSSSVHCSPLEQLLRDDSFPHAERLSTCPSLVKNLHKISDMKGVSVMGYKYNEEKTLSWLVEKVHRAANSLISNCVSVASANTVQSNNYLKHSSSAPTHISEDYLRLGFGVVSEYLSTELRSKLEHKLALTCDSDNKEESAGKRTRTPDRCADTVDNKRSKPADPPPASRHSGKTGASADKNSAKHKARAKAAAGTKSISCFFTKATSN